VWQLDKVTPIKVSLFAEAHIHVHSVGQKSIALKFSKSRTGSDVRYSCHHNSSPHSRSFTVRKNPLYLLQLWCQFVCKVTYPSRLHNKHLSVYPHPSCLRQVINKQKIFLMSFSRRFMSITVRFVVCIIGQLRHHYICLCTKCIGT
jgi:hypothetical protein